MPIVTASLTSYVEVWRALSSEVNLVAGAGQGQPPGGAQRAQVADLGGLRVVREQRPVAERPGPELELRPRHDDLSGPERGEPADVVVVRNTSAALACLVP